MEWVAMAAVAEIGVGRVVNGVVGRVVAGKGAGLGRRSWNALGKARGRTWGRVIMADAAEIMEVMLVAVTTKA